MSKLRDKSIRDYAKNRIMNLGLDLATFVLKSNRERLGLLYQYILFSKRYRSHMDIERILQNIKVSIKGQSSKPTFSWVWPKAC